MPSAQSSPPPFAVVVPAAGVGRRMGGATRKPYVNLAGMPLLYHTLRRLRRARGCEQVVLVVHPDRYDSEDGVPPASWGDEARVDAVARGGRTRQQSVEAGLELVREDLALVLIHDAARPLVRVETVESVAREAARTGAAVPALPCGETVKELDADGLIRRTCPRRGLWLAQTPQGFDTELIRRAHARARDEGVAVTDDAELVERLGHPVAVVEGDRTNIKITTPADLLLAEALLKAQAAARDDESGNGNRE